MTVAEIVTQPEFVALSPQQQIFVRTICENGRDKLAAAKAAYVCKDDASARTMANRALAVEEIRELVDARFEKKSLPTKEDIILKLMRRGDKAKDDRVAIAAYDLAARMSGFLMKPADPRPEDREESMLDAVRALEK
jgi:hypothetical protein